MIFVFSYLVFSQIWLKSCHGRLPLLLGPISGWMDGWMDDGDFFATNQKTPTENTAVHTRLSYQTKVNQKSKH
jgi:hypothetical protein